MARCSRLFAAAALCAMAANVSAEMMLDECRRKAAAGDAEAIWQLGRRHETGNGVRKDRLRALVQYRKAAELKHVKACKRLAEMYAAGDGVVKDPAKSARYRAMAKGEDGESAAKAAVAVAADGEDPIQQAIDMIEGTVDPDAELLPWNHDVSKGIRKLYDAAKQDSAAKTVFVGLWEKGLLDGGLAVWDRMKEDRTGEALWTTDPNDGKSPALNEKEWGEVVPWFREQYKKGMLKCGLVLGNYAFKQGLYAQAVDYWISAGDAGVGKACWRLALFSDPEPPNNELAGPKDMRSYEMAKTAYDQSMLKNWRYANDSVKYLVGVYCAGRTKKCADYPRALKIFAYLMKKHPQNKSVPYWYGIAGLKLQEEKSGKLAKLLEKQLYGRLTRQDRAAMKKLTAELKVCYAQEATYIGYLRKAAEMGNEAAREEYERRKK